MKAGAWSEARIAAAEDAEMRSEPSSPTTGRPDTLRRLRAARALAAEASRTAQLVIARGQRER